MFKNKTILITGGTGSFGQKFTETILKKYSPERIIIFSRDALKQFYMQEKFKKFKNLRFFIGDVRDRSRLELAMENVDYVVHAAALKNVPLIEYNPFEAVQTNIIGAQNIINASIKAGVSKIIALSTDKAAYPINAMGISKAMMEKVAIAKGRSLGKKSETIICCTRYGNVMGSRGSVIPFWIEQIKNKELLLITDPEMTRFFLTLEQSVKFVINSISSITNSELFIPKMY